jgi:D-alanyl-D-alanine carboxypeptidase (penicillin-binding protein 5/6)
MNQRRTLAIILLVVAILIVISIPVWLFTPLGANVFGFGQPNLNGPPLAPLTITAAPRPALKAVLTPRGAPGQILASEAILMDADTGSILYEKDAEQPVPMASTTKIMTALIAIQSGKLNRMVTIGQDAVNEVIQNDGSGANLVAGDRLRLQDLLYGMMLPSGDDAAIAIADAVAGSVPNFVTIMNVEARRLHLYQTLYSNPDGLEYGLHYTTAYDLVRLARYAMSIPLFAQIVQTKEYDVPASSTNHAYQWKNINQLLFDYQGSIGIKTGWTPQAGGCLVAAVRRNGHMLISVVLNSANETTRFTDAQTLLNWGFGLPVQIPRL